MPSTSIFSASWYRVRALRPRLRSHAEIHRHQYRGETWYVLQELTSERFFRFAPAVYSVIGLMDGRQTVDELWQQACSLLGDDGPTQDEMIRLLAQLYQSDVLQCDVPPDAAELLERQEAHTRRKWQSRFFSVFSWRFPLLDPERILETLAPVVRPLFSWPGALVWLIAVVPGLILFAAYWEDLTQGALDRVLVPDNVLMLWFLFPVIKTFHEFGHAFATKAFGGEVHEMGVMLLVVTPVPYVDASSASAFQQKWRRVLVGTAGIMVELFIASLALFFWLMAEPGFVRAVAYNTIFIAGVSTLFFNANPLLRFDGYYILADLIEIPNLRSRANSYLLYLLERYLFGNAQLETPDATRSERAWFVSYGILSFSYRILVVTAILLFVASRFFTLGVFLAIIAGLLWLVVPLFKGMRFLFTNPRIGSVRSRAVAVTVTVLLGLSAFIGLVPMPYRTGAEGVIWIPEESFVRAGADGFVQAVLVEAGTQVRGGAPLIRLENFMLATQERISSARILELEARYQQYLPSDPVRAETTLKELSEAQDLIERIREETGELVIRGDTDGVFIVPSPEDLPGRFVRRGELLGYIVEDDRVTVRTVVSQPVIDLVRSRTDGIDIRLSESLSETVPATMTRIVPGASEQLPSRALGLAGGGRIATDPTDTLGMTAVESLFQIDLEIPSQSGLVNLGGRGYVRFDHGWTPLGFQWYFQLRQLFLSRFGV